MLLMKLQILTFFLLFLLGLQNFDLFAAECCKRDYLYIRNAKISTSKEVQKFSFLKHRDKTIKPMLGGHYISPGDNLVILIREFDCGRTSVIDDESFKKITIEIEKYISYIPIGLNSPAVKFNYSAGSSAWIKSGGGGYSTRGTGKISIMDLEQNELLLELDVKLLIHIRKTIFHEAKNVQIEIRKEYVLKEITIDELTPWLGVPDPSEFGEVYAE